jgi:hypothetical protein
MLSTTAAPTSLVVSVRGVQEHAFKPPTLPLSLPVTQHVGQTGASAMFVIDAVAARAFQQFVEARAAAGHLIRYGYGTWDGTHTLLVTRDVVRQFEQWAQAHAALAAYARWRAHIVLVE